MKTYLKLILVALLLPLHSIFSAEDDHFKLSDVIPTGKTVVEILTVAFGKRAEELSTKFQQGIQAHRDWWIGYVKTNSASNQPLPYHPNLGLTEKEYREYLDEMEKSRRLDKSSEAWLIFKRSGDVLSLDTGDPDSPLEKLRLDLAMGDLKTSAGAVGKPTWRSSDSPEALIGPYEGYSWHYEKTDKTMSDIRVVSLDIYRLKRGGKIFWRLKDSEVKASRNKRAFEVMFQYTSNHPK